MKEYRLTTGDLDQTPSNRRPRTVVEQKPLPYSSVNQGTAVNLVYAVPVMILVPNLIGKTIEEAESILRQDRLHPGNVTIRHSDHSPGTITQQTPAPGSEVPAGTAVHMTLAKSKELAFLWMIAGGFAAIGSIMVSLKIRKEVKAKKTPQMAIQIRSSRDIGFHHLEPDMPELGDSVVRFRPITDLGIQQIEANGLLTRDDRRDHA